MSRKKSLFIFVGLILALITITGFRVNSHLNIVQKKDYLEDNYEPTYYDWNAVKSIDYKYSYSTLFATENTKIEKVDTKGVQWYDGSYLSNKKTKAPTISNIDVNESASFLITNCALDKDGDMLDVLVKIDNVKAYSESDGKVGISVLSNKINIVDQDKPDLTNSSDLIENGDLIIFELKSENAYANLSLTYYKSGTFNKSTKTGTLGKIDSVNALFGDIDIVGTYTESFMNGNEGVGIIGGLSKIYYNKDINHQVSEPDYRGISLNGDASNNGIKVQQNTASKKPNGLWFATSATILTDDIKDATYKFTFGGASNDAEHSKIYFTFNTPYSYTAPKPEYESSTKKVSPGSKFEYKITQYIPNNYHGAELNFNKIVNELPSSTTFQKYELSGELDENLILGDCAECAIKIVDESGADASDYFEKKFGENNQYTIKAKAEALNNILFYNHIYYFKIEAQVSDSINGAGSLENENNVTTQVGDEKESSSTTTDTDIKIVYKLTVNYYNDDTKAKIAESEVFEYESGTAYETGYAKIDPEEWELVSIPENAKGTITSNVTVDYYFKVRNKNPNTGDGASFVIAAILMLLVVSVVVYFVKQKLYRL